jgi:UDP-N-acetylmuramate--alanine ligase
MKQSDQKAPSAEVVELPSRVHVVGMGGAGMGAIATLLIETGRRISGSDLKDSPQLERLRRRGATVFVGHSPSNIEGAELVAASSAIRDDNPEVTEARRRGLPVASRADMLAALTSKRRVLAVAGTHGKTTTTALLARVLQAAGFQPGFLIGGDLIGGAEPASLGATDWMVVEADESDGTFLRLNPTGAIVTNVEADHLDHYGSIEQLIEAFGSFVERVSGPVVLCADDEVASSLSERSVRSVTYGTSPSSHYRIEALSVRPSGTSFDVVGPSGALGSFRIGIPGAHLARNATAALVLASQLGAELDSAAAALESFQGVARRWQRYEPIEGVTFVDDYAHLPSEVRATLAAARASGHDRVVCVFQPHRYSRVGALWQSFGDAFVDADLLVVTEVYAAGEEPVPGVSGELVATAAMEACPGLEVVFAPGREEVVEVLARRLRPGDLCVVLSAGDMVGLHAQVFDKTAAGGQRKTGREKSEKSVSGRKESEA